MIILEPQGISLFKELSESNLKDNRVIICGEGKMIDLVCLERLILVETPLMCLNVNETPIWCRYYSSFEPLVNIEKYRYYIQKNPTYTRSKYNGDLVGLNGTVSKLEALEIVQASCPELYIELLFHLDLFR